MNLIVSSCCFLTDPKWLGAKFKSRQGYKLHTVFEGLFLCPFSFVTKLTDKQVYEISELCCSGLVKFIRNHRFNLLLQFSFCDSCIKSKFLIFFNFCYSVEKQVHPCFLNSAATENFILPHQASISIGHQQSSYNYRKCMIVRCISEHSGCISQCCSAYVNN